MNKTTTVGVIAVGAVLAVIVTRTPAQVEYGDGACCLPNGTCAVLQANECAALGGSFLFGGNCAAAVCQPCAPPDPPTVVSMSVSKDIFPENSFNRTFRIFRAWSDGQVDHIRVGFGFEPGACDTVGTICAPIILIPGSCPTDINRDGDTGIQDFLTVLGLWGPCK